MSILFEIKSRIHDPSKLIFLFVLYIEKALKIHFNANKTDSVEEIDVVIPTINKDFALLEIFISSIKNNILNPIHNIYIISETNRELSAFCKNHNLIFVDENTILGYGKTSINYVTDGKNRNGWLFQQLLKLGADKLVSTDSYAVIDSDTILLNNHNFLQGGKYVFFESNEWHQKYFDTMRKLLGFRAKSKLSFVAHMMIFDRAILNEMKSAIESIHHKKWDQAIISLIDQTELSYFSEYETYGNYVLKYHADKIITKPFYNKSLTTKDIEPLNELKEIYSEKFNSVSFHNWIK